MQNNVEVNEIYCTLMPAMSGYVDNPYIGIMYRNPCGMGGGCGGVLYAVGQAAVLFFHLSDSLISKVPAPKYFQYFFKKIQKIR